MSAGNLQGFLWDDHGAFKTPERPLQKAPQTVVFLAQDVHPCGSAMLCAWAPRGIPQDGKHRCLIGHRAGRTWPNVRWGNSVVN